MNSKPVFALERVSVTFPSESLNRAWLLRLREPPTVIVPIDGLGEVFFVAKTEYLPTRFTLVVVVPGVKPELLAGVTVKLECRDKAGRVSTANLVLVTSPTADKINPEYAVTVTVISVPSSSYS